MRVVHVSSDSMRSAAHFATVRTKRSFLKFVGSVGSIHSIHTAPTFAGCQAPPTSTVEKVTVKLPAVPGAPNMPLQPSVAGPRSITVPKPPASGSGAGTGTPSALPGVYRLGTFADAGALVGAGVHAAAPK